MENKELKEKTSPETCVKAGKCMMKEMINKMQNIASEDEYKNMSSEEKDKADEKEVLGEENS